MTMKKDYKVGIVGATGAVGQELTRLLIERSFPAAEVRLLASARSAGKTVKVGTKDVVVQEAKAGAFAGLDLAFFAAGGSVTRALASDAVKSGVNDSASPTDSTVCATAMTHTGVDWSNVV